MRGFPHRGQFALAVALGLAYGCRSDIGVARLDRDAPAGAGLHLSLQLDRQTCVIGEPLAATLCFTNRGGKGVPTVKPYVGRFVLTRAGRRVPGEGGDPLKQGLPTPLGAPNPFHALVYLSPGEAVTWTEHLTGWFPLKGGEVAEGVVDDDSVERRYLGARSRASDWGVLWLFRSLYFLEPGDYELTYEWDPEFVGLRRLGLAPASGTGGASAEIGDRDVPLSQFYGEDSLQIGPLRTNSVPITFRARPRHLIGAKAPP